MQTIFLAAKHDWVSVRGAKTPRALYPLKNDRVLSELPTRLSELPSNQGIHVVTNSLMASDFAAWKDSLGENCGVTIHDNGRHTDGEHGAVHDLLFVVDRLAAADDLFVLGGSNWFTFDTNEFLARSLNRAPTVLLSQRPEDDKQNRFGMVQIAADGRILAFDEKKTGSAEDGQFKASCAYYFAAEHIELIRKFAAEHPGQTSTGDLFAWISQQVPSVGIVMNSSFSGPDFIEFHNILWESIGDPEPWILQVVEKFENASSLTDLTKRLGDPDPNARIFSAYLIGRTADLLGEKGRKHATDALLEKLADTATNQIGADDDDEEIYFVCASAAEALAALGYAESPEAAFEKAKADGRPVDPRKNQTA